MSTSTLPNLHDIISNGEVLEMYPLTSTFVATQSESRPPMEALITYNDINYHVKFTADLIPTGEYSVAEIHSDDQLTYIDNWQEQLLRDLHIDEDELVADWDSIDDFSDVDEWDDGGDDLYDDNDDD